MHGEAKAFADDLSLVTTDYRNTKLSRSVAFVPSGVYGEAQASTNKEGKGWVVVQVQKIELNLLSIRRRIGIWFICGRLSLSFCQ